MKRLLVISLSLFALANVARAVLAAQQAATLSSGLSAIPPGYIVVMGIGWAIAFGIAVFGGVRSRPWAARVTIAIIVLYQANLWLNHFAFSRSGEAYERTGFAALLSIVSIVLVSGAVMIVKRQTSNVNRFLDV